ncbi:bacterial transcriptional activator domain-containing protein [Bacillus suaedae]|uniref:Bacterial transcriptional activator domain-containing protein n=1 Tax=Halalkalibacter suaedae TaxID=2822140 RepID=A0A941ARJ1_9BACI|nr:bacterial transcriptional activator domain-containing protein [Bacillus suaedae]MBP3952723.1 bacterial transcriptional activator domain-containing protein [Bacillus suaedae]
MTEWTLFDRNEKHIVQPTKLIWFQQCKVVECVSETNTRYRLFFYKNEFLTAREWKKAEPSTFLAVAEKKGVHFEGASSLISMLLEPVSKLEMIPFNQLLANLKKNYSIQETALIFSYFDAYLSAAKLDRLLKDFHIAYRRNGQLALAYHLAITLYAAGYKESWVKDVTKHLDYAKVTKLYKTDQDQLLTINPIYAEQKAFTKHASTPSKLILSTIYKNESRHVDAIALALSGWSKKPYSFVDLLEELSLHLSKEEVIQCLLPLCAQVDPATTLHENVYQLLLEQQHSEQALNFLLTYSFPLTEQQKQQFPSLIKSVDLSTISVPPTILLERILLLDKQPILLDQVIQTVLPYLNKSLGLQQLLIWLEKQLAETTELASYQKLKRIQMLIDEPEQQFELGKLYYELNDFERAIDCFVWETELAPQSQEPLRWLIKAYQQAGKQDDALAYQQLMTQLQRTS